ncbi:MULTISPECIES: DUF2306 domain-containing protein [Rhizobium/Agrobacterium group]|jgi:uncharacterized membrane protein|uniref:DUF2306 domain-containing protein n=1 Tax=Agrobacterium tumefaciens TaxID=358 RepID=A0A1B9U5R7_AGRTU|nr:MULTISPECIES: DUF2306 domain-containing protein [Rhizobium/Agrobacterium group]EHJ98630.1 hypothetical protein AT5A_08055 [Agrobacterium tumefaciens 5A]MDP9560872.1 putative membrane protein [Rhizobium nepotum]KQY42187.1 hypothetical protein ASD46_13225 [Rhizobium sp. Root491]MBO9109276.1 DUF2306 domain-containing protein [Agrobacterium sp. S2/73]MDR5009114.1 DUF2306 domain-containing protein [Agrobacterium tumefaciens]
MSLQPLLDAPLAVQFHVATVVPAAILGAFIFLRPKGTAIHRLLGRIWVTLMVMTSVSTFFIHELRVFYGFSPIHLLSVLTIYGCLQSVLFARRGEIRRHMRIMQSVYLGGIVIAGGFTFVPGRIIHEVAFGDGQPGLVVLFAGVFVFALLSLTVFTQRRRAS